MLSLSFFEASTDESQKEAAVFPGVQLDVLQKVVGLRTELPDTAVITYVDVAAKSATRLAQECFAFDVTTKCIRVRVNNTCLDTHADSHFVRTTFDYPCVIGFFEFYGSCPSAAGDIGVPVPWRRAYTCGHCFTAGAHAPCVELETSSGFDTPEEGREQAQLTLGQSPDCTFSDLLPDGGRLQGVRVNIAFVRRYVSCAVHLERRP